MNIFQQKLSVQEKDGSHNTDTRQISFSEMAASMEQTLVSLNETRTYLNQLQTASEQSTFDKIRAQQFKSWQAKFKKMKLSHADSMQLMTSLQDPGPWTVAQKSGLLESINEAMVEVDLEQGKQRCRQSCRCFHDFLTAKDIEAMQSGTLFMRLQVVARRMVSITLHLPTEPTLGHILEFLALPQT